MTALLPTKLVPLHVLVNEHRLYMTLAGLALATGALATTNQIKTDFPIVAIMSHRHHQPENPNCGMACDTIEASYVKWVESAGGRAVRERVLQRGADVRGADASGGGAAALGLRGEARAQGGRVRAARALSRIHISEPTRRTPI